MNDPDRALIDKAMSGNKAAFGKLIQKYYEMVYAVAYGVLSRREEALDTAQEVFIKAFREIENFKGESKFKTWLYRITINTAIDATRRRRPEEPIDESAPFETKALSAKERALAREKMLYDALLNQLIPDITPLQALANALAECDVLFNLAEAGKTIKIDFSSEREQLVEVNTGDRIEFSFLEQFKISSFE